MNTFIFFWYIIKLVHGFSNLGLIHVNQSRAETYIHFLTIFK